MDAWGRRLVHPSPLCVLLGSTSDDDVADNANYDDNYNYSGDDDGVDHKNSKPNHIFYPVYVDVDIRQRNLKTQLFSSTG